MPESLRALVVEDNPQTRTFLHRTLQSRGHEVEACESAEEAWLTFKKRPYPLVLIDVGLPGIDGLELCRQLRALPQGDDSLILVITGKDYQAYLREVLEAGANDYIPKPFEPDTLDIRLTIAEERIQKNNQLLRAEARLVAMEREAPTPETFQGFVGRSSSMLRVYHRIELAAQSDVSVLVGGESGTGKEMAAQAIHALSPRASQPFIGINAAAIPESLLESELFGHVKGSFTGAFRDKTGLFEAASGGTLFLDEIGDISPVIQAKLLRVLQEGEIRRVGDETPRAVDVRLISATHHDLNHLRTTKQFRDDLYYRICVFDVTLPPLRERTEDIPMLVDHFIYQHRASKAVHGATADALEALTTYPWPGNIRELQNAVQYALVVTRDDKITRRDLPQHVTGQEHPAPVKPVTSPSASSAPDDKPLDERTRTLNALIEAGGKRTRAAELLGVSRVTLWKRMRKHDIEYP